MLYSTEYRHTVRDFSNMYLWRAGAYQLLGGVALNSSARKVSYKYTSCYGKRSTTDFLSGRLTKPCNLDCPFVLYCFEKYIIVTNWENLASSLFLFKYQGPASSGVLGWASSKIFWPIGQIDGSYCISCSIFSTHFDSCLHSRWFSISHSKGHS